MGICSSNKYNKNNQQNKHQIENNKLCTITNTENENANNNNKKEKIFSLRKNSIHTRELNRISNKTILDGNL
jgi:hypothetical protein